MEDFTRVKRVLAQNGFQVNTFKSGVEAASYLNKELDGTRIGFGGSRTVESLGLFDSLGEHNAVYWHWRQNPDIALKKAAEADVYICSVNGISETGELIFVDAAGNRTASVLWGHQKLILIAGRNKIMPDYQMAVRRCRDTACTLRNADFPGEQACQQAENKAMSCFDCTSRDRLCNAMLTLWRPMESTPCEVILIDEDLGY